MKTFDNIAFFGCKATTLFLLQHLQIPFPVRHLITIKPEAGEKFQVADYCDLRDFGKEKGIEVYQSKYYSLKHEADQEYISGLNLDIAFVIGWQRLIPAEILSGLSIGAFGMHGSSANLPLGRGRSPMNWSLIEGRQAFYTNLFRYDPGVDSGDVVDTFKFQITLRDTAETMHFKNVLAMKYLIEKNIGRLVRDEFVAVPQKDTLEPTYYPKRTPADSLIDWDLDVYAMDRFVRAVTRPFNGAFTFVEDRKVILLDAQVFDLNDFGYNDLDAGTVAAVFPGGKFLVKCLGGLLLVTACEADIEIVPGMRFHNNGLEQNYFGRNHQGNFDLREA